MSEKPIPEQIIDDFIGEIAKQDILKPERLLALKAVLATNKPKKVDILEAIREDR